MADDIIENMMAGYALIDNVILNDIDLLTAKHAPYLLELNHIVLCGLDLTVRKEYRQHIEATTQRFYQQKEFNINDVLQWHNKHKDESSWKRAAGVYVRLLSQPQLYFEGNHRTGALIMSYILARDGRAPFVLTVENAQAYFDPSTLIKETQKTAFTICMKLPGMKKRFANFLKGQANEKYLSLTQAGPHGQAVTRS